jgi:hypothetical protein
VQFDDFDPAGAHLVHEIEMITACVLHPHHLVEQQIVAVAWGKPLVCQPGRANQHLAQFADFRIGAVFRGR